MNSSEFMWVGGVLQMEFDGHVVVQCCTQHGINALNTQSA